jgi:hypothetical protein
VKKVEFEGVVHEFPDDFTDDEIGAALSETPQAPEPPAAPVAEPSAPPVETPLSFGFGASLPAAAAGIGETIDAVTGNPIRGGISAMQDESESADPSWARLPFAMAQGMARNFGNTDAPTSKAIYERAGYSGESGAVSIPPFLNTAPGWVPPQEGRSLSVPSPAGSLGFILDMATPVPGIGEMKAAGSLGMKAAAKGGKVGAEAANVAGKVAAGAVDAATNTKAGSKAFGGAKAALSGLGQGMDNMAKALKSRYGSSLATDAEKSIQTAIKNGIDPKTLNEAILFGPETSVSRQARALGESPMGQHLRERNAKLSEDIQGAIRADIRRIGGEVKDAAGAVTKEAAIPANAQEAGDLIKTAYDAKVDKTLGDMDVTYKSLAEQAPDAKIPPSAMGKLKGHLDELEKYATDLGVDAFDDVTESQAKHLLKTIDKVRNAGDNLGSVTRGMQGLGRTAFKVKTPLGQIPPDLQKIRSLYGDLSEAVTDGVGARFGKETAEKLRANNRTMTELFGDKSLIPSLGDAAKSEDKLFRSLVLDGDSKRINTLKKYLSPEELGRIKAATLEILNKENIQGGFTFRNNLSQRLANKSDALNALFNPGELDNITDLFKLGDKIGPSVLSTSGTGGSLAHQAASWGDWVSPGKVLDKAERGADKLAAAKQKGEAARAIGFEMEPQRHAAQGGNMPPMMGFSPADVASKLFHGGPAFRKKAFQMYGAQNEEENNNIPPFLQRAR